MGSGVAVAEFQVNQPGQWWLSRPGRCHEQSNEGDLGPIEPVRLSVTCRVRPETSCACLHPCPTSSLPGSANIEQHLSHVAQ